MPNEKRRDGDDRGGRSWRRWQGWLRRRIPVPSGFESSRELAKWLVLGSIIGVVAGLGAVLFYDGLELATRHFLGGLASYVPPGTVGESGAVGTEIGRRWALPLVAAAGGLVSEPSLPVRELVAPVVVSTAETLEDAMLAQAQAASQIAAVTEDGAPKGIATARGILATYRAARGRRSALVVAGGSAVEDAPRDLH